MVVFIKSGILKIIIFLLFTNILFISNIYPQPEKEIKNLIKSIQETHNKINKIESKLEITSDINSATIVALALLPFYDTEVNFKYQKPDYLEYWQYKAVGVFHTTSTVKIQYDTMKAIVKLGARQEEYKSDVPVWIQYFINIKEKFSNSLDTNIITIERKYVENGDEYYLLKFVPTDKKDKRPICGRDMFITINASKKRIEGIKGFLSNDISDTKTFELKINYNNLPTQVLVVIKHNWCNVEIRYRFYDLIIN